MSEIQFHGKRALSVTEAAKIGLPGILKQAENGESTIVERHGKPVAAIIGMAELEQLNNRIDDINDLVLVTLRAATDDGKRYSLDEVARSFGFDPDELRREVDEELRASEAVDAKTYA